MARESWGKVESVYVNFPKTKIAAIQTAVRVSLAGIVDDKHSVLVRDTTGARDEEMYGLPKRHGVRINTAPWRQITLVDAKEMENIARQLDIPHAIPAQLASMLGANILVSGICGFSKIPSGSAVHIYNDKQAHPVGTLKVEHENLPCDGPGHIIAREYAQVDPLRFKLAALGQRGLVATVLWAGDQDGFIIEPGMDIKVWQRGNLVLENKRNIDRARTAVAKKLATLKEMDDRITDQQFVLDMTAILIAVLDRYDVSAVNAVIRMLRCIQTTARNTDDEINWPYCEHLVHHMLPIPVAELPEDVQSYLEAQTQKPPIGVRVRLVHSQGTAKSALSVTAKTRKINNQWKDSLLKAVGLLVNLPEGGLEEIVQAYNLAMSS